MTPPPATLDGARVLYWTGATDVPFYYLKDGPEIVAVTGFAVARYDDSPEGCYVFTCDSEWNVLNDWDAATPQEAFAVVASLAKSHLLLWNRSGVE